MVTHIQEHEQEGLARPLSPPSLERDNSVKLFLIENAVLTGGLRCSSERAYARGIHVQVHNSSPDLFPCFEVVRCFADLVVVIEDICLYWSSESYLPTCIG
jgi:hypothetical protein